MATIKAVSSKCRIGGILDYVTKEEKTEDKLLFGLNCSPKTVYEEMQVTKELWGKTDGRTYKHFVQSFHKDENITLEQAHELAKEFAEQCSQFQGFEVLIATHKDKEHIHTHFVLNSVSFEDGHKFRMHKSELQEMKDLSDQICSQRGLHICEKGRTFEGAEREETSAYTKETYQLLKKAEHGEVKSYVQDIALAVLECQEKATSQQDFIQRMKARGYGVDWKDNHKYITFTDLAREEQGEKQCKVRNNKLENYYNMDFGKEELEHGFEVNARKQQARERARQGLAVDGRTNTEDTRVTTTSQTIRTDLTEERLATLRSTPSSRGMEEPRGTSREEDTDTFIRDIETKVRSAETSRQEREIERSRQHIETEYRIRESERRIEAERTKRKERSRS